MPISFSTSSTHSNFIDQKNIDSSKTTLEQFRKVGNSSTSAQKTDTDRTSELLEKLSNKELATKVAKEIRQAYKAGLGSTNKAYCPEYASTERKEASRTKANKKNINLLYINNNHLHQIRLQNSQALISKKTVTTPSPLRIDTGNCGELASASAKLTIENGGYAEKWEFAEDDHAFTVIGKPPEVTTVDFKTWIGCWVVDPWANIVCEAPEYVSAFNKKMIQWADKGKAIASILYTNGDITFKHPLSKNWISAITSSKKVQCMTPSPTQKNPWAYLSLSLNDKSEPIAPHRNHSVLAQPLQEQLNLKN